MIPVPGFEGRRVAVFGLGRSGITAARALKAGGALPVLWDDGVSGRMQAEAEGFVVEDLTVADWSGFAALVLSPGAPLTHPEPHWTVDKAHEAGVPSRRRHRTVRPRPGGPAGRRTGPGSSPSPAPTASPRPRP